MRYLFAGKLRIAAIRGNQMQFLHQDHLGSVVLTTDANGLILFDWLQVKSPAVSRRTKF